MLGIGASACGCRLPVTIPKSRGFSPSASPPIPPPVAKLALPADYLEWTPGPGARGRLFLSKTFDYPGPPWKGAEGDAVYHSADSGKTPRFAGVLEFLIDPLFICGKVTADVRSGRTGYAWIIDQHLIMLAHYEKEFVGHEAMEIRIARNPQIVFRGLQELHATLLGGKEGVTEYDSGWHRQKLGQMPKLAAYTPISFTKG